MISKTLLRFLIYLSFLYSYNGITYNFSNNYITNDYINVDLESHNKTIYYFDFYNPFLPVDVECMNFKLDGSMMYPLANTIPKKIHFGLSDSLSMSQISFIQDHSNRFYDTGVALKTKTVDDRKSIIQVESKSINSLNYNKKFIVSINRKKARSYLDFGYMYTDENIFTLLNNGLNYNRELESFNTKLYFDFKGSEKLKLSNQFNTQIANYNKFSSYGELNFLSKNLWNKLNLTHTFDKVVLNLSYNFKYINTDIDYSNEFFIKSNIHKISSVLLIPYGKHSISFGIDKFNSSKTFFSFLYNFSLEKISLIASLENNEFLKIYDSGNNLIPNINLNKHFIKASKIELNQKISKFQNSMTFGKNEIKNTNKDFSYFYYLLKSKIKYNSFKIDLKYGNYDSQEILINNYLNIGLTFLSDSRKKRFKPFWSISFNHLNINNNFSFSNNELDLISYTNSSISKIQVFDGEIGLIFEDFKISFIKENMLKNYMFYSNDMNSSYDFTPLNNISTYLINVIWIFRD
ncbi:MAG: hypothetical protein CMG61_01025 [Candidatus Marinimicrobia bacterium]|nr:hypothetical protein [Candidatus Neomarinimicrobiota bacterium]